jgi:hypothetical protein
LNVELPHARGQLDVGLVVLSRRAATPVAVLLLPVVLSQSASKPMAVVEGKKLKIDNAPGRALAKQKRR